MVRKLIAWALDNPVVVILGALFLAMVGFYSFMHVNVEAYPDPAPAIVEVIALFPGASAEEVERQVTIPLEVTFAGMPGLKKINSKSLFGLSDLKMTWHYGSDYTYQAGRQEVINRLATISQPLPANVTPAISPESPTGEIYRYILKVPKDASGKEIYTLNDIKAMQDWVLEREFRTVPRIVDAHQLRRHRAALRGPARPRPPSPLRHHAGSAPGDADQRQRHRGRRLPQSGPGCHDGAERRPVRRRPGSGEQGAGAEEPDRRRRHPPRGGTAPDPRNPQPGHHLGQQPADPRRGRGRGRTAALRAVARRTGRGRQPPDAPGTDRLLEGRPRAALGLDPDPQRRRPRRGRQSAVHRAPAQGRGYACPP